MQQLGPLRLKRWRQSSCSLDRVCYGYFRFRTCLNILLGVKDLIGEINSQLLATISNEFDEVEGRQAPEPSRTSADVQNMAPSGSSEMNSGVDAIDDLFPRVELDGLLKGTTILADSKSDAWKTKKEALETLQAILDQGPNKRLKPAMGLSFSFKLRKYTADTRLQARSVKF